MGTATLARTVRGLVAGTARARDLGNLAEAAGFMSVHGYCAHCRTAAAVTTGLLSRVAPDVAALLEDGGAAAKGYARHPDPFASESPERAAIEAAARERMTTVFFLFLLHAALGLLATLPLVPDRAGTRFFKLCSRPRPPS